MDFLKWFLESSIFGTILGFCLGKFGSVWDENKKKKEEGGQLLRNLLQEISNNRFKCQAIIQGRDAVYFETFSWDSLRLSR